MIITQTPLRISFAGGGTDIPSYYESRGGGHVVSAAIDKYVTVNLFPRFDDKIYVHWSKIEIVDHVDQIQHELVREVLRLTGIKGGIEILMQSDIPAEGSGLGSSSSVTVGLLNACHVYQNDPVGPAQLAEEACEIEINRCKKPIGKQDQFIAAYGGLRSFHFEPNGAVRVEALPLSDADLRTLSGNLFLFYTGRTRSANPILAEQGKNNNGAHLDAIRELADDAYSTIYERDFDRLGMNLARNWSLKKRLANGISDPAIDAMYDQAVNAGALGGKIVGAGGGGFLLVYCRSEQQPSLMKAMAGFRHRPFLIERKGSRTGQVAWK